MVTDFLARCDAIEECYEFMLAYAGQGLPSDQGNSAGSQVREFLRRAAEAMSGLAESCSAVAREQNLQPAERYRAFLSVLERDAQSSLAACELVLAQPSISSQLIDNLNASIHLRALLTDLFLLEEVLKEASAPEDAVTAGGKPEDSSR
jgi:hypothetical protein